MTQPLDDDIEILVTTDVNGPARYSTAAERLYYDTAGSRPILMVALVGQPPHVSPHSMELGNAKEKGN
jgi:hypothetical protein